MEDLLPFLIAAVYLAFRFARAKARPKATPRPSPAPRPRAARSTPATSGPTPFEQLLARLEEADPARSSAAPSPTVVPEPRRDFVRNAAAMPDDRAEPRPAPRPESPMFTENRAAYERDRARAAETSAFRSLETTRPEASRGFSDARGFEAEARGFEHDRHGFGKDNPISETTFSLPGDADRRLRASRAGYDPHGLAPTPAPAPASRLGSPQAIREASVLSTILGRRPPPRRRSRPAGPEATP